MDKEEKSKLKKEFKQTEFGKKVFKQYIIAVVFFFIALITEIIFFITKFDVEDFHAVELVVFAITCYYEGQYEGALKQYIEEHKKK